MTPTRRRPLPVLGALGALVVVLVAAAVALWAMLPGDEQLARRIEAEFQARFGPPLVVGGLRWRLLGGPVLELRDVHTQQQPEAIQARRITLYPALWPLLRQRLVINRLEVDGAVLPRQALAALRGEAPGNTQAAEDVQVRSLRLTDTTYISHSGTREVYEGEVDFDDDRLPRRIHLLRPGVVPPVTLQATRDGKTERGAHVYRLSVQGAGGTAQGQARLLGAADGGMTLNGELAPRQVDVQALLQAFHRRSPIGGVASGDTTLHAEGESLDALFRSLRTRSVLSVERARMLRFNLDKAVKSLGRDTAGETALDSLSGVMETQNTAQGLKTEFTDVKAAAGIYSATGRATLQRRQIDAQGRLEVAGGVVDVPFALHGPTRQPEVELAWGSLAGAAVGTAVLPGIGTVLGAKIGGVLSAPPETPAERARRERTRR